MNAFRKRIEVTLFAADCPEHLKDYRELWFSNVCALRACPCSAGRLPSKFLLDRSREAKRTES